MPRNWAAVKLLLSQSSDAHYREFRHQGCSAWGEAPHATWHRIDCKEEWAPQRPELGWEAWSSLGTREGVKRQGGEKPLTVGEFSIAMPLFVPTNAIFVFQVFEVLELQI